MRDRRPDRQCSAPAFLRLQFPLQGHFLVHLNVPLCASAFRGFKIAWNINRLETHSFSSSRCLPPSLGWRRGLPGLRLEGLENISNEVFLGLANARCLAAFPRSGRPRCVGRKKRAVVFQLGILQRPGPRHPLVPKERSLWGGPGASWEGAGAYHLPANGAALLTTEFNTALIYAHLCSSRRWAKPGERPGWTKTGTGRAFSRGSGDA